MSSVAFICYSLRGEEGHTIMGEMPLGMQAQLLRVLEQHQLCPVGRDREVAIRQIIQPYTKEEPTVASP